MKIVLIISTIKEIALSIKYSLNIQKIEQVLIKVILK